ncbi:MAG: helix-turn-helix transcriptional regulator [Beijerinckiaceae bacterium]
MELLTTSEAASYLRLKERKIYELAADGAIPCTKVTGKWLFPRPALDRWLLAGLPAIPSFIAAEPAPIMAGSHDPLLEWALRESRAGLALLAEGSEAGLRRFQKGEAIAAAIHLHDIEEPGRDANVASAAAQRAYPDAILVAFARREQGLLTAPGNPARIVDFRDAAARRLRFAHRPKGAGAELLARALARSAGVDDPAALAGPTCPTGADLAAAILNGRADFGVASRSVATPAGLHFVALEWERFDIILRSRDFSRPTFQTLLDLMRSARFRDRANEMTGYDVSEAGKIRFAP